MDKGRQIRPELDQVVLSQVCGQSVHSGLQPGQLHEKVDVAGGGETLVTDEYSEQDDQDRGTAGAPCTKDGVSAGRGAGYPGNADRHADTDRSASPGSRIACSWRSPCW